MLTYRSWWSSWIVDNCNKLNRRLARYDVQPSLQRHSLALPVDPLPLVEISLSTFKLKNWNTFRFVFKLHLKCELLKLARVCQFSPRSVASNYSRATGLIRITDLEIRIVSESRANREPGEKRIVITAITGIRGANRIRGIPIAI